MKLCSLSVRAVTTRLMKESARSNRGENCDLECGLDNDPSP